MRANYAVAAMWLAAAACGAAENPAARGEVEEAQVLAQLTQRRADYADALRRGDGQAVGSFWSADAIVREAGMKLDGAAAVTKYASDFFAKGKVDALDIRPERVFVHDDAAYEFGAYDETGTDGTNSFAVKNYYVLKWQREADGQWRLAALVAGPREAAAK